MQHRGGRARHEQGLHAGVHIHPHMRLEALRHLQHRRGLRLAARARRPHVKAHLFTRLLSMAASSQCLARHPALAKAHSALPGALIALHAEKDQGHSHHGTYALSTPCRSLRSALGRVCKQWHEAGRAVISPVMQAEGAGGAAGAARLKGRVPGNSSLGS